MSYSLSSPIAYASFLHNLPTCYPFIHSSSLVYIPLGTQVGKSMGMVLFADHLILCVQEFLNFELQVIEGYSYEVSRSLIPLTELPSAKDYCRASYPNKEKEYWYDSFPHPHDLTLAMTHPHHKHIHPDIKHHRVPAPELTFTAPNLPFLLEEIARVFKLS